MNRALFGATVRGQAPPPRGPSHGVPPAYGNHDARGDTLVDRSQDARSNFAVQPAASTGSFRLKKNAVKIVGAATPLSNPSSASPAARSSPAPAPVNTKPKEAEHYELAKNVPKPSSTTDIPASTPTKTEPYAPGAGDESALDELFERLSAQRPSTLPADIKQEPPVEFYFEATSGAQKTPEHVAEDVPAIESTAVEPKKLSVDITSGSSHQIGDISQADLENLYLRKASEYLDALPAAGIVPVQIIKLVSTKLRSTFAPNNKLSGEDVEKLQARYAFAVVNYINQVYKQSAAPIKSDFVKKALIDGHGDVLMLYNRLVEEKYLSLDDLDTIAGLAKTILDALPKPEPLATPTVSKATPPAVDSTVTTETTVDKTSSDDSKSASKDSVSNSKGWPTQEKRESPPAYRSCILKGVSSVKSINQLQALVWGGRLESVQLPAPGSDFAVVRFLTPEACDKYFKATENGIEIQGDKKSFVFVEKLPGPTSINDVMRNCIEGDASRCVRALDAEEDWSDMLLMKLARGKGAAKRDVDRIKQGKTARGRYYIEFRFGTIYHALNFKRELHEDPDWEPCTISYATDPCETAQSVHYNDQDEEGAGFFA
ncbi:hypothetical protein BDU57DRAFT_447076 [Ampelomyces quisqualis]|uniref:Uncharacterized protein n=1 Tax=Ampelomyces quisqualis TaxID=50730 RepID=A0A6A5QPM5_AMPQU|nr:hypothetical protein BDU57DRAFT_447076 [Ampelomyces quisqualis]